MFTTSSLKKFFIAFIYFGILIPNAKSFADWDILPESNHQLYHLYGLFTDEQSSLLSYGNSRVWTGLGGTLPLYGNLESEHKPTFLVHASANAALRYNDTWRIYSETLDVRLGATYEWQYDRNLRFSISYDHFSGHSVDGLPDHDADLAPTTLGQEFLPIRMVYDLDNKFRFGVTIRPVLRTYPELKRVWADQSVEYYPRGAKDIHNKPSPYFSLGLEESGINRYVLTTHLQAGIYFGNHFSQGHRQTVRVVLGYYSGADPRLKYFQFREARKAFVYFGMMFDI